VSQEVIWELTLVYFVAAIMGTGALKKADALVAAAAVAALVHMALNKPSPGENGGSKNTPYALSS